MQPVRSLRIPLLREADPARGLRPAPAAAGDRGESRAAPGARSDGGTTSGVLSGVAVKPQIDAAPPRGNTLAGESQLPGAALDHYYDRALVPNPLSKLPATALVVAAAFAFQGAAALATTLFDEVGPLGATWLRQLFAALVLLALNLRVLRRLRSRPLGPVVALGLSLAVMNSFFYAAIGRIPLGLAVTIEFLGPLGVAVAGSRRARDYVWIVLAAVGVALLG